MCHKSNLSNGTTLGFWNASNKFGTRYRIVNQTAKCLGGRLFLTEKAWDTDQPTDELSPVPASLCPDEQVVTLIVSNGTLVPAHPSRAKRPAASGPTAAPPPKFLSVGQPGQSLSMAGGFQPSPLAATPSAPPSVPPSVPLAAPLSFSSVMMPFSPPPVPALPQMPALPQAATAGQLIAGKGASLPPQIPPQRPPQMLAQLPPKMPSMSAAQIAAQMVAHQQHQAALAAAAAGAAMPAQLPPAPPMMMMPLSVPTTAVPISAMPMYAAAPFPYPTAMVMPPTTSPMWPAPFPTTSFMPPRTNTAAGVVAELKSTLGRARELSAGLLSQPSMRPHHAEAREQAERYADHLALLEEWPATSSLDVESGAPSSAQTVATAEMSGRVAMAAQMMEGGPGLVPAEWPLGTIYADAHDPRLITPMETTSMPHAMPMAPSFSPLSSPMSHKEAAGTDQHASPSPMMAAISAALDGDSHGFFAADGLDDNSAFGDPGSLADEWMQTAIPPPPSMPHSMPPSMPPSPPSPPRRTVDGLPPAMACPLAEGLGACTKTPTKTLPLPPTADAAPDDAAPAGEVLTYADLLPVGNTAGSFVVLTCAMLMAIAGVAGSSTPMACGAISCAVLLSCLLMPGLRCGPPLSAMPAATPAATTESTASATSYARSEALARRVGLPAGWGLLISCGPLCFLLEDVRLAPAVQVRIGADYDVAGASGEYLFALISFIIGIGTPFILAAASRTERFSMRLFLRKCLLAAGFLWAVRYAYVATVSGEWASALVGLAAVNVPTILGLIAAHLAGLMPPNKGATLTAPDAP